MKTLSVGDTLEILKKYTDLYVNSSGLNNYDINSPMYKEMYKILANEGYLEKDKSILPEFKAFSCLLYNDSFCKRNNKINYSSVDLYSRNMIHLAYCFWNWNSSKIIYKFDKDIEQDLIENSDFNFNGQMPVELFNYLPHDNFFVATPELNSCDKIKEIILPYCQEAIQNKYGNYLDLNITTILKTLQVLGFFFSKEKFYKLNKNNEIEEDVNTYRITVLFHYEGETYYFSPIVHLDFRLPYELNSSVSISDCFRCNKNSNAFKKAEVFVTKLLPYIFYLCSENVVIEERKLSKKQIKRLYRDKLEIKPIINRVSKPLNEDKILTRVFPSVNIIANTTILCKKNGTPKCPHERRSHWHRFWIGKKNSNERRLVLKWISSMKIRADLNNVIDTKIKVSRRKSES